MKLKGIHVFIGVVIVAVITTVVAAFMTIGSPKDERARALDRQRLNDLISITSAIDTVWNFDHALPQNLDQLTVDRRALVQSVQDPETGLPYEYHVNSSSSYELCATFSLPSSEQDEFMQGKPISDRIWNHDAGRKCYTLQPITYPK